MRPTRRVGANARLNAPMLRIAGRFRPLRAGNSQLFIAKSPGIWLNSPPSALKLSLAA
jgi:hypothetical protein